uniref:Uncharacterized protein n=1 Tax=viral metagenome TaxID=1070528 RepID=A0A6C0JEP8_9ZZZZ
MENIETIEKNINMKLWEKIPVDVFINHIIPYTYQKIDSSLLNDIRNFVHDYRIILNYYAFDMNEYFLIHDIILFCSNGGISLHEIQDDSFVEFLERNVIFKKLSLDKKYEYIQHFHHNLTSKIEQKNKFLFALFTPSERAHFINKYIIEANE